ncbi:hypothetical protein OE749_08625 [Aestuariibacter sp. AA17]|uniref:Uncharacterized protein n=2 Tax=Fluctibacter corallii TaxID=2984329 RepID=A0ABT3A7U7_9ALTE|nr:hypothetical protein [Aestuariibacter sp. AA17]
MSVPFLEILQEKLPSIGFCNTIKIDYESGFIEFVRDIADIELVLGLAPCSSSKGEMEFSVQIGFDSKTLKETLDLIKPWECNPEFATFHVDRSLPKERVANLNFYLLINSFDDLNCPSTFTLTPSSYIEEVETLLELLRFSLENCVLELSSASTLSNELVNLAQSGLNRTNYGLSSSNAIVHAALLLDAEGDKEKAMELLGEGLKLELESNNRTWGFDKKELEISNQITLCQFDKYIRYVKQ